MNAYRTGAGVVSFSLALVAAYGAAPARVSPDYGKLPLSFEGNRGQADSRVKFLSRGSGYSLFLTSNEAVLSLAEPVRKKHRKPGTHRSVSVLRIKPVGANPEPRMEALDPLPGRNNYFFGDDPKQWHTDIPTYGSVKYSNVYPGVDLVYYGNRRQLEFDFVVARGADPSAIRLSFDGARKLTLDRQGDLLLHFGSGHTIVQRKPVVWQETADGRKEIAGRYVLDGRNRVGFELASYNRDLPLVIDPILGYSTFFGGLGHEDGDGIAVDADGNTYIAGDTTSNVFPTVNAYQSVYGGTGANGEGDSFVCKLNASGTALLYSTYLGGIGDEYSGTIAVDAAGSAYLTGYTDSANFPRTAGVFGNGPTNMGDVFVVKLSPDGKSLVYSGLLGGGDYDEGIAIAIDSSGNAYVTGETSSANFPTVNPYQAFNAGAWDIFVSKISADGTKLLYSTYFGGTEGDDGFSIAVDAQGNAYITGDTYSANFPLTPGSLASGLAGGQDAFVAKFDTNGGLVYSTYLGGSGRDEGDAIAVDAQGNAYIGGETSSLNFPVTAGVYQQHYGGGLSGSEDDGFILKLDPLGKTRIWGTFLGGSADDGVTDLRVDAAGNVYVCGDTTSPNFPTTNDAVQKGYGGNRDAFVAKLDSAGKNLLYGTYLGGSKEDRAYALALDAANNIYVTGFTRSTDFLLGTNALQTTYGGGDADAFVTKLTLTPAVTLPSFPPLGVVNAASAKAGTGLAPGEFFALYGHDFGPSLAAGLELAPNGKVATTISNTTVFFDGIPAPLTVTYNNQAGGYSQVNGIVPYEVAGQQSTSITVRYMDLTSAPVVLPVIASSPAIFTVDTSGTGRGAILNHDLSLNSPSNPEHIGSVVVIYATGEGQTTPAGIDGLLASIAPLPTPVLPVSVKIGGIPAPNIQYKGAAPSLVAGTFQVNVVIPAGVTPGDNVKVELTVGTANSRDGVTIAVR